MAVATTEAATRSEAGALSCTEMTQSIDNSVVMPSGSTEAKEGMVMTVEARDAATMSAKVKAESPRVQKKEGKPQ